MTSIFKRAVPAWRIALWSGAAVALLAPWMAMRVTAEVNWTALDFAVFGLMLSAVCAGFEIAMRVSKLWSYRLAAILTVGGCFLMVWANLAVGIIGNEENPRNSMFYAIPLVALAGALVTRLDAQGLKWTLRLMAALQLLIAIVSAALDWALLPVFTAFYVALWLSAAELFARTAQGTPDSLAIR